MAHEGSSFLLTTTIPDQQRFRWKPQTTGSLRKPKTTARDAIERVKRGGRVKNDTHVRKLIQDTAEARYYPRGKLKDLSLGAVITLALSFTAAEWAAVNRDPTLLQETLDYFKTGDFQIDRWWTYWRNLQLEQPKLAKLFLLEIIHDYWKDDVTGLIEGVRHISNERPVCYLIECEADGPMPKRRKANSNCTLSLTGRSVRNSTLSSPALQSNAKPLSANTGRRLKPQAAGLPCAEDRNAGAVPARLPINGEARESPSSASLNTTNTHDADEQRRVGEIVSNHSRLERTGVSTISAVLNHDSLQPTKESTVPNITGQQGLDKAAASDIQTELNLGSTPIPHQSDAAPAGASAALLRAIRFEKRVLQQIVHERPEDILGGIWFGSPAGFQPFVSLRLSRALDAIVKQSGHEIFAPGPPTDASNAVTGVAHLIKTAVFRQMIERDGFGEMFWNECGEEAFVRMDVVDESLAADFIRGAVPD